ncbi:MAG: hypothetical protein JWR50_1573 [Mucilaginibacter sp.]|nr:hypothetical protein [Mucilaginibacter sp.]
MRKPLLLIAIITCVAIGCKLDESGFPKGPVADVPINKPTSLLINKWYLKKVTVYNDPVYGTYDTVGFTNHDYYNLRSDNTFEYSSTGPDTLLSGKYTYDTSNQRIIFITQELDTAYVVKLSTDSLALQTVVSASIGSNSTTDKIVYKYALK